MTVKERYDKIMVDLTTAGTIWDIIQTIATDPADADLKDLGQDIILYLYRKPIELLEELIANGQMDFYLTRMVINQLRGSRSTFHTRYKSHKMDREDINDNMTGDDGYQ